MHFNIFYEKKNIHRNKELFLENNIFLLIFSISYNNFYILIYSYKNKIIFIKDNTPTFSEL